MTPTKKTVAEETMVTISMVALRQAFRQAFPDHSAQELFPAWLRMWKNVVAVATITPKIDD